MHTVELNKTTQFSDRSFGILSLRNRKIDVKHVAENIVDSCQKIFSVLKKKRVVGGIFVWKQMKKQNCACPNIVGDPETIDVNRIISVPVMNTWRKYSEAFSSSYITCAHPVSTGKKKLGYMCNKLFLVCCQS